MSFGERFLRHPDLFPRRLGGERPGRERVRIDLAGGPYVVGGLSAILAAELDRRFAPLVSEAESHEVTDFEVFAVDASEFRPVATRDWEYRLDTQLDADALSLAGLALMARVSLHSGARAALWTPAETGADFLGPFENVLRVLVAYRLNARGGVMLHSVGVVRDGRAFVFFGRSGAGKSTFAGLSARAGLEVLSDELNLIWPRGDGAVVESLPFAGDFGQHCKPRCEMPLGGMFRLHKGPPCGRQPLSRSAAVAALVSCSPTVNSDPSRVESLLEVLGRLVGLVPPESLAFELTANPWGMLSE